MTPDQLSAYIAARVVDDGGCLRWTGHALSLAAHSELRRIGWLLRC